MIRTHVFPALPATGQTSSPEHASIASPSIHACIRSVIIADGPCHSVFVLACCRCAAGTGADCRTGPAGCCGLHAPHVQARDVQTVRKLLHGRHGRHAAVQVTGAANFGLPCWQNAAACTLTIPDGLPCQSLCCGLVIKTASACVQGRRHGSRAAHEHLCIECEA